MFETAKKWVKKYIDNNMNDIIDLLDENKEKCYNTTDLIVDEYITTYG